MGTYSGTAIDQVKYEPVTREVPSGKIIHGCFTPSITIKAEGVAPTAPPSVRVPVDDVTARVKFTVDEGISAVKTRGVVEPIVKDAIGNHVPFVCL